MCFLQFTTFDVDRDWNTNENCATMSRAGWWFRNCTDANLNGPYSSKSYEKCGFSCKLKSQVYHFLTL